jgi:hypothetical protein
VEQGAGQAIAGHAPPAGAQRPQLWLQQTSVAAQVLAPQVVGGAVQPVTTQWQAVGSALLPASQLALPPAQIVSGIGPHCEGVQEGGGVQPVTTQRQASALAPPVVLAWGSHVALPPAQIVSGMGPHWAGEHEGAGQCVAQWQASWPASVVASGVGAGSQVGGAQLEAIGGSAPQALAAHFGGQAICEQASPGDAQSPQLALQHTWPAAQVFGPQEPGVGVGHLRTSQKQPVVAGVRMHSPVKPPVVPSSQTSEALAGEGPQALGSQAVALASASSLSATSVAPVVPLLVRPQAATITATAASHVILMGVPSLLGPAAPFRGVNEMSPKYLHGHVRSSQWQPGAVVLETTQRPVLHPRLPSLQVQLGPAGRGPQEASGHRQERWLQACPTSTQVLQLALQQTWPLRHTAVPQGIASAWQR